MEWIHWGQEKKEEIWLSPMTLTLNKQNIHKIRRNNTKTPTQSFDYTSITDRLKIVAHRGLEQATFGFQV